MKGPCQALVQLLNFVVPRIQILKQTMRVRSNKQKLTKYRMSNWRFSRHSGRMLRMRTATYPRLIGFRTVPGGGVAMLATLLVELMGSGSAHDPPCTSIDCVLSSASFMLPIHPLNSFNTLQESDLQTQMSKEMLVPLSRFQTFFGGAELELVTEGITDDSVQQNIRQSSRASSNIAEAPRYNLAS